MTIFDYIKSNINQILEIEGVERVRYGVSKWSGSHIIEITPSSVFDSHSFLNVEISISEGFESLFPSEELMFISNSDIVSLPESLLCMDNKSVSFSINESFFSAPQYKLIDNLFPSVVNQAYLGIDDNYNLAA